MVPSCVVCPSTGAWIGSTAIVAQFATIPVEIPAGLPSPFVAVRDEVLYVAEFHFRHNNRENVDIFGSAIAAVC